MKRYLFTFLFHPAARWHEPHACEETVEAVDEAAAWAVFESIWYRNTSDERCREVA